MAPAGLDATAAGKALTAVAADFVHAHSLRRPSPPKPGAMERIGGMMKRLGLQSERTLVQLHVLLGGALPGEVLLHPATDQSLPLFLVSIDLQRQQHGAQEYFRSGQGESETGGGLMRGRAWQVGNHRVGQPAGPADDGNGAVAEAVE